MIGLIGLLLSILSLVVPVPAHKVPVYVDHPPVPAPANRSETRTPPVVVVVVTSSVAPALGGAFALLRQCESSGNYGDDTGNGFYGAYQFDLQTWHGLGYSGLPSSAPDATQDQAAARLQSSRGWEPWPSCSRQLGLR